jgi:thiamine biosynthesis lipoprotein
MPAATGAELSVFEIEFSAMGTRCSLSLFAATQEVARTMAEPVIADVTRLEAKYSRYKKDSFLSAINRVAEQGGSIEVDSETAALLDYAHACYEESDGLFDITSGLLRRAWNFQPEGQTQLPDAGALAQLLTRVGWENIQWKQPRLSFPRQGMELDFGGVVKEYAVDRACGLLQTSGAHHALVNLGGDVGVSGAKPDGSAWHVAISDPEQPDSPLLTVELSSGALASSGSYARALEINGQTYSHLLNPKTGYPFTGLQAASVVADQCTVAGSLATIALLKQEHGRNFLEQTGLWFFLKGL